MNVRKIWALAHEPFKCVLTKTFSFLQVSLWVDWKFCRLWRMFYSSISLKGSCFCLFYPYGVGRNFANSTVNILPTDRLNCRPWLSLTRGITSTLHVFFLFVPIMQHNAHNRSRFPFSVSPLSASLPCRFLIKPSVSSTLFTWAFHFQACWKNCEKWLFTLSRLSAWTSSAHIARIFMKFDIWVFFENLSRKFMFL
jgi:hypothetical protein